MSRKAALICMAAQYTALELDLLPESDDDETDEILDFFFDDLYLILSHRYGLRQLVSKSDTWLMNVLPRLDKVRFKQILRMTREQFDIVLHLIEQNSVFLGENSCHQLPVWQQLAIVLFRLGSSGEGASISKISALFGIGDGGTLDKVTKRVFAALMSLEKEFISWPNSEERDLITARTMTELPRCIGYLDGSEIHLAEAPVLDHESYFSRKQRYGIKIQAVCDHQLKIRNIVVGFPASVHDARIYANSQLALRPNDYFTDSQWLAADLAYRLTEYTITPFRRNSSNQNKSKFNKYFSGFRVRIENCFGMMKEKFASLKELRIRIKDTQSHKYACEWITCCCILHNVILPYLDQDDFIQIEPEMDDVDDAENNAPEEKAGEIKRDALLGIIFG